MTRFNVAVLCLVTLSAPVRVFCSGYTVFPAGLATRSADCGTFSTVATADVDGDGKLDVIVAGSDGISLFRGNGDGTLQPCTKLDFVPTSNIIAADVDGDGKVDLLAAQQASNQLRILHGNGDGTFAPAITVTLPDGFKGWGLGESKGDAFPELAVVVGSPGTAAELLVFAAPQGELSVTVSQSITEDTVLNNNPWEVALWRTPDGQRALYILGGSTTEYLVDDGKGFVHPGLPSGGVIGPALFADFNNDGYLDMATTDGQGHLTIVYGSKLNLSKQRTFPFTGRISTVADLNGDGYPDLVGPGTIALNRGDGTFDPQSGFLLPANDSGGADVLAIGDFDGDGRPDLLIVSPGLDRQELTVVRGLGSGKVDAPDVLLVNNDSIEYPFNNRQPILVVPADVDRDGYPDLVVVTDACCLSSEPDVIVFRNRGDGTFERMPPVPPLNVGDLESAVAGDFDGDGNLDVAIQGSLGTAILFGTGRGDFVKVRPALPPGNISGAADMFHEGVSDLLIGDWLSGFTQIVTFGRDRNVRAVVQWPFFDPADLGDLDGNGLLDAVGLSTVILNGGRSAISCIPTDPYIVRNVTGVADVDGVGLAGVWAYPAENPRVGCVGFSPSMGHGTFGFPRCASDSWDLGHLYDWNHDGRVDVINRHSILMNRGDGTFERLGQLMTATLVASADLNADGHMDAVAVTDMGVVPLLAHPSTLGDLPTSIQVDLAQTDQEGVSVTPQVSSPGGVVNGTVTFLENGIAFGSTDVRLTAFLPLQAGTHQIVAHYSGDASFAPSDTAFTVVVPKMPLFLSLVFAGNLTTVPVTVTAVMHPLSSLTFEPKGTIQFVSNGSVLATVSAAVATTVSVRLGNSRPIAAVYSGDDNYLPAASDTVLFAGIDQVISFTDSFLSVTPIAGGYSLQVQLYDPTGNPLSVVLPAAAQVPFVKIGASRGLPNVPTYLGNGLYQTSIVIDRAIPETLTFTASVNGIPLRSVFIGPGLPRHRAVSSR